MDRVLIVIDNVQFSGHLENTLRKVGYVTEVIQNEYNLTERILSFKPDIIVARGASHRLSTLNVGKRLKDNAKFTGKVVLVFNAESSPDQSLMSNIKVDVILQEPASALKIVEAILNLDHVDKAEMLERLYKMAQDDLVFRTEEQSYLVQHGKNIDDELQIIRSQKNESPADLSAIGLKIQNELHGYAVKQSAKIEAYNQQIDKIDIDLKKGFSKRKTKEENKLNRKDWGIPGSQEALDLDIARKEFTTELFKKKPK